MKNPLLSIVIPCLNEKRTIQLVINDALYHANKYFPRNFELIVADNGSVDGTLEILKKNKKVKVVNIKVRGYGAALHYGILASKGKYVLFGDADCSYPFSNLNRFKTALKFEPDMILGSRLKGSIQSQAMPTLNRYLGTPVLTFLIRSLYKIPTTDCNSGMRIIRKSFYKSLNIRNSGMEWASEVLLKTAIKGGKYLEVPIRFIKDRRGKPPHMSRWSDGWRHLKTIIMLKPSSLYPLLVVFPLVGLWLYDQSFSLAFLFLSLTCLTLLGLGSMELLKYSIEKPDKPSPVANFISEFKLVPITLLFSSIMGFLVMLLPDERLGTKLFFVNIVVLTLLWLFFVETVKTHLINRLS